MRRTLFLLIAIAFVWSASAQKSITGTIIDSKTKAPLPFTTVYINGTTNGTISNSNGEFRLEKLSAPCDVVVSRIGYKTHIISISQIQKKEYKIFLEAKVVEINEVKIEDKNYRERNLKLFRKVFLGVDKFGKAAKIKNEDSIEFKWHYAEKSLKIGQGCEYSQKFLERLKITRWNEDSTKVYFKSHSIMTVSARSPIQVYSPLLGYNIFVDLVYFSYAKQNGQSQLLGYYYFKSIPKIKSKIEKNRKKAYYNSAMHFFRSLHARKLAENGYQVFSVTKNKTTTVDLEPYFIREEKGVNIIGRKNERYTLVYFCNGRGEPTDLTKKRGRGYLSSDIQFLSDTCFVLKNGVMPNVSIVFTPTIGAKSMGAALPANYSLPIKQ